MNEQRFSPVYLLILLIFPSFLFHACVSKSADTHFTVEISNLTGQIYTDALLKLDDPDLLKKVNAFNPECIVASAGRKVLPSQIIDTNNDGISDRLLILCDIGKQQKLNIIIDEDCGQNHVFEKRTQAELSVKVGGKWEMITKENGNRQYEYIGGSFQNINEVKVPDENTDNSFYFRYEGPGWESDKIAYRFYLDWRNATDIFGKKTTEMVLQQVGLEGFDSYHEYSDWGMDILKVGNSLGLGSIGFWNREKALRIANTDSIRCKITQNGPIHSSIKTNYYGWKDANTTINLESQISIDAGSRLSHQQINLSEGLENICTGIVKHKNANLITSNDTGDWSYMASYGKQSLNDDNLGMFIFYKTSDLIELQQDEYSHVLVLKLDNKYLDYFYGAIWEDDVDNISSRIEFLNYLNKILFQLNNPINIKYSVNEK